VRHLALVTGANRGLGRAVAEALARGGYRVLLAGRQLEELSREAARLLDAGLDASPLRLDLADPGSIAAAAAGVTDGPPLDLLIQNAGVYGEDADRTAVRRTLVTNLAGPIQLSAALVPRLASRARVVLVSSGMGELSGLPDRWRGEVERAWSDAELLALAERFVAEVGVAREDGAATLAYRMSKALLNRHARRLAEELAPRGILVNAVCPGWVKTAMGGPGATRSIEEGARSILWAAALSAGGPTGGFFRDGQPIGW
jgi:NAD(P)-dependent dehydrogenase (short-subunit alcohol dehydrogenase family)